MCTHIKMFLNHSECIHIIKVLLVLLDKSYIVEFIFNAH